MENQQEAVFVPDKIREQAEAACEKLIPEKSKENYVREFELFEEWKKEQRVSGINEDIVLAYLYNYRKRIAPSSLWTKYSMLKNTCRVYKNVDISKYGKVISYLKSEARTHKPKKANILEREHIQTFLKEAPDSQYLMAKVALMMGVSGACRCDELTKLTLDNIEDKGGYLYVKIPDTKTNISRSFTIVQEGFSINVLELYRKYVSLRPKNVSHRRVFLNYKKEKCTIQPVGINTLSKIPQTVAAFLKLPDVKSYTGHSMRRSSATLLANAGADLTTVKRHGGWKSSIVAEGYIQDSVSNKIDIANKIQSSKFEPGSFSSISIADASNQELNSVEEFSVPESSINTTSDDVSSNEKLNFVQEISVPECNINMASNNVSSNKKTISFNFNVNINLN